MKKIILCLVLLLLPFTVSAKEVEIKDFNLKINFDDDWYVFTRENVLNNSVLEEREIDTTKLLNFYKLNDVYLDALPNSAEIELFILVKSTPGVNNLTNYPDKMIESDLKQTLYDELKKYFDNINITTTKVGDTKYFYMSYYDKSSKMNILKYYTVINAKGFNFQIQKEGEFTDKEKEDLKNIVSSVKIEIDPLYKNEPSSAQKEIDKFNKKGSKSNIFIFVIIGAVIGMVIFALASKKHE